jgi:hypothetical protein
MSRVVRRSAPLAHTLYVGPREDKRAEQVRREVARARGVCTDATESSGSLLTLRFQPRGRFLRLLEGKIFTGIGRERREINSFEQSWLAEPLRPHSPVRRSNLRVDVPQNDRRQTDLGVAR